MGQSDPSGNVPYRVLTDAARVAVFRSATRFSLCAGLPGQPPQRFRIPVTVLKGPANAGLLCLDQPLAKVRTATSLVERRLSPSPERPQPRLLSLLATSATSGQVGRRPAFVFARVRRRPSRGRPMSGCSCRLAPILGARTRPAAYARSDQSGPAVALGLLKGRCLVETAGGDHAEFNAPKLWAMNAVDVSACAQEVDGAFVSFAKPLGDPYRRIVLGTNQTDHTHGTERVEGVGNRSVASLGRVAPTPVPPAKHPADLKSRPSVGLPQTGSPDELAGGPLNQCPLSIAPQGPVSKVHRHRAPGRSAVQRAAVLQKVHNARIGVHRSVCVKILWSESA
jgi:hypothetical protein